MRSQVVIAHLNGLLRWQFIRPLLRFLERGAILMSSDLLRIGLRRQPFSFAAVEFHSKVGESMIR